MAKEKIGIIYTCKFDLPHVDAAALEAFARQADEAIIRCFGHLLDGPLCEISGSPVEKSIVFAYATIEIDATTAAAIQQDIPAMIERLKGRMERRQRG